MGMERFTLRSADPSTVWLADLIRATEAVAAFSAEPCDPAAVKAFSHRLEMRTNAAAIGYRALAAPGDAPCALGRRA